MKHPTIMSADDTAEYMDTPLRSGTLLDIKYQGIDALRFNHPNDGEMVAVQFDMHGRYMVMPYEVAYPVAA